MAKNGDGGRIRDPLEKGEEKANRAGTSGNREESMTESGKDAFGDKSAVRNPDSTSQGDGAPESDENSRLGRQRSDSSGTTPLGGESSNSGDLKEPGGVEGRE